MNLVNKNLNLARKYRSRTFDELVGQHIPVKTLKNSLYLKKLFPVYLFAGQRGCGKTSTARIFAAAINCKNLTKFQEDPTNTIIPCLECDSCKSMAKANHPDFIEIDAASNTGVENVRQILETSSYMPVIGAKKIYLIDEAHMLSKAAFNAFLKILEEPPKSALFILASTELQKFPDTILSRCFQVMFKPINNLDLKEHLKSICQKESIDIEDNAIDIFLQQSQGSARDALNLLERVRFLQDKITVNSILKVLGKISEKELFDLFEIILDKNPGNLLNLLSSQDFQQINPQILWDSIIELSRSIIWIKYNIKKLPTYFNNLERLNSLSQKCSINKLNNILQIFWNQEEIFLRTEHKNIFLEKVLLDICLQTNSIPNLVEYNILHQSPEGQKLQIEDTPAHSVRSGGSAPADAKSNGYKHPTGWPNFIEKTITLKDPVLNSILTQSKFLGPNINTKKIELELSNNSNFFKNKIKETEKLWSPFFKEFFPEYITLELIDGPDNKNNSEKKLNFNITTQQVNNTASTNYTNTNINNNSNINNKPQNYGYYNSNFKKNSKFQESKCELKPIDTSDKEKWPKASLLTQFFPGTIKQNN